MTDVNKKIILNRIDSSRRNWGLHKINAPKSWKKTKGEGVKILLIDTGIEKDHVDLKDKFKGGYNFFERSDDVSDDEGHGTFIAGLLIGEHTGVAPNAELYVMKSLNNDAKGTHASIMDGITYALNYGFDIICMSLGTPDKLSTPMKEQIQKAYNKGIIMVSATGNTGGNTAFNPAQMEEVIAVGGIDKKKNVTSFTNGGYDALAPSVDILSTYINGKYAKLSGTSMAAAFVTGGLTLLISLYKQQGKEISPKEIKEKLEQLDGKIFDVAKLLD